MIYVREQKKAKLEMKYVHSPSLRRKKFRKKKKLKGPIWAAFLNR